MKFRTRFDGDLRKARPVIACTLEERRTKSEFLEECDINRIVAKYKKTGVLPESARAAAAQYGDFSQTPDFMEMQHKIIAANELFAALPAAVRRQFDNDPGQFIAASETEEGRQLMVKLGLGEEAGVKPDSSPQEPSSAPGGGQPPKTSPKVERKPNEASKTPKTEESSDE